MTDEDLEWWKTHPLQTPRRIAAGYGLRADQPCVVLSVEIEGASVPLVVHLTPDVADHLARTLRKNAGAVRARQEQEA